MTQEQPKMKVYFSTIPDVQILTSAGFWPNSDKAKPPREVNFVGNFHESDNPQVQADIEGCKPFRDGHITEYKRGMKLPTANENDTEGGAEGTGNAARSYKPPASVAQPPSPRLPNRPTYVEGAHTTANDVETGAPKPNLPAHELDTEDPFAVIPGGTPPSHE